MKVLSPIDWLEQNKDKYPNGSIVSEMMQDYAEYYHEEKLFYNTLRVKWESEGDDELSQMTKNKK
tara:strand:+ start:796 stop:990 length:195 start_codon:yes stop_codon:yes gene_type:complete